MVANLKYLNKNPHFYLIQLGTINQLMKYKDLTLTGGNYLIFFKPVDKHSILIIFYSLNFVDEHRMEARAGVGSYKLPPCPRVKVFRPVTLFSSEHLTTEIVKGPLKRLLYYITIFMSQAD